MKRLLASVGAVLTLGAALIMPATPAFAANTDQAPLCNATWSTGNAGQWTIRFSCTYGLLPYDYITLFVPTADLTTGTSYDPTGHGVGINVVLPTGNASSHPFGTAKVATITSAGSGYFAGFVGSTSTIQDWIQTTYGQGNKGWVPGEVWTAAWRSGVNDWRGTPTAYDAGTWAQSGDYPLYPQSTTGMPDPPNPGPGTGATCQLTGADLPGAGGPRAEGETATVHITWTGEVEDLTVIPDVLYDTENVEHFTAPLTSPKDVEITFAHAGVRASVVQLHCGDGTYSTLGLGSIPGGGSSGGGGIPPEEAPKRPAIGSCFSSAGFGLNPSDWGPALAKAGSCMLQALFVPAGFSGQWQALQQTAKGSAIDGAGDVVTNIVGLPALFISGATSGAYDCKGLPMDLHQLAPTTDLGDVYPFDACSGTGHTLATWCKLFMTFGLLFGGASVLAGLILPVFGIKPPPKEGQLSFADGTPVPKDWR